MARPQKDNADYFSHDCDMRNDSKIKAIRTKFGVKGYAFWCMILEVLTNQDNFEYPCSELDLELLAGDLGFEYDEIVELIEYCHRIKLLQYNEDKTAIFSIKHKDRFEPLIQKRERQREYIQSRRNATPQAKKQTAAKKKEINPLIYPEQLYVVESKPKEKVKTDYELAVDSCKELFSSINKERTGVKYSWSKEESSELSSMVDKLIAIRKDNGLDEYNIPELNESLANLLNEASEDSFINNIFTAKIINKNFNQIVTKMMNKKTTTKRNTKAQKMKDLQYEEAKQKEIEEKSRDLYDSLLKKAKEEYISTYGNIKDGKSWILANDKKIKEVYVAKCNELNLPIVMK